MRGLGSSPRWRGALDRPGRQAESAGLIPAVAGSTCRDGSGWLTGRAHPRGGGEHSPKFHDHDVGVGSSPRWRGARCSGWRALRSVGLIPAVAGSTRSAPPPRTPTSPKRAHPRGGGEHTVSGVTRSQPVGSSPRWRGAPGGAVLPLQCGGLIPAVAGSTSRPPGKSSPTRAHPRGGGEHLTVTRRAASVTGSSPRWRGAPRHPPGRRLRHGLIPAVAGSTCRNRARRLRPRAHPRGGGEHSFAASDQISARGSSPRWRGARASATPASRAHGLIPAVAGSTPVRSAQRVRRWAHPRGGGEHCSARISPGRRKGSSPRWRGALVGHLELLAPWGLIPAVAGSTPA